jgi:hypothetical protein
MKIINAVVVASLLAGSAWAGDVSYIVDPSGNNQIVWVQKQGNVLYVTESDDMKLERMSRRMSERRRSSSESLLGDLLDIR